MTTEINKTNKMIAVYARVSTANQENEGTIETQLSKIREFAREKGYTIVQEYKDEGWSGSILARPQLDQLRQDAKKKVWEAVLAYDPDRIARNGSYQELIREELEETGIDLLYVTIPPAKSDEDKIMNKMRGVFAEYEKMKITERFRLGKVRKAKEGHIIVSEAPYGYNFIKRVGKHGDPNFKQGYYEINEDEAKIVNQMFSWVANDGLTIRGVASKLKELGIPPRKSKRDVWNTSTLITLFRNTTYIGEGHYGATTAIVPVNPIKSGGYKKIKKTSRIIKPKEDWIIIPTPVIIDRNLFVRVQERLKNNKHQSKRNTKNEYLLASKIMCSCGCTRSGASHQKGKHLYYRCNNRIYNFPLPPSCFEKGINARIADDLVWKKLAEFITSPELLKEQAEIFVEDKNQKKQGSGSETENLKREVLKLKEQEDRYNRAYGAGLYNVEQLGEYINPLREKISSLNDLISKSSQSAEVVDFSFFANPVVISNFVQFGKETFYNKNLSFGEKQVILRSVVDKVISSGQELLVRGYVPVQDINYTSFCAINRNRRIAKCGKINAIQCADEEVCANGELPVLHD